MSTTSVIIATYNRAGQLHRCLSQLARQQFLTGDEVIVVDNGSTDSTPAVLDFHSRTFPVPLRGVNQPRPGKSYALASAIKLASGDILAFTDDDVQVDEQWLNALRVAMADPGVALAGGPVEPRWERKAPRWLRLGSGEYGRIVAPLGLLNYGAEPAALGERTLLGANMAVRRSVLHKVGGFALHLGKLRGTLLSGEDHELCRRVQTAGFTAIYSPAARVRHWVPEDRMRITYFLNWFFWSGITNASLERGEDRQTDRATRGVTRYQLRRAARNLLGTIAAAGTGRISVAVDRATEVAFAAGYVAGRWGLAPATTPMRTAGEPA